MDYIPEETLKSFTEIISEVCGHQRELLKETRMTNALLYELIELQRGVSVASVEPAALAETTLSANAIEGN